ncbi:hypothetical protein OAE19_09945 [Porticoccaceae bacterium]|nr:hypothetical protein [Porticoccaceae bacterium]
MDSVAVLILGAGGSKRLSSDNGAKRLLQTTQLPVIELDMPEASFDVDKVDDMSALHVHYNRR